MQIDPITTEVVSKYLQSVVDEMGSVIVRTAFSTNIKEREDCSTAILNEKGEIVSLAEQIPIHLGSLLGVGSYVLDHIDLDDLSDGDVFIGNDAYRGGGTHLNDIVLMQPIFVDGRYCGWATNLAHHADFVDRGHKHIYQEGLRIPPVRLCRKGELQQDVLELILLNCQVPRERKNDLAAQMAANRLAVQRYRSLCERYTLPLVKAVEHEIMNYAERKTRKVASRIPNGIYRYSSRFDTNLIDHILDLNVAVEVKDGNIHFDLSDNPVQVNAPINMVLTATLATLYYVVKTLVDADVPPNAGFHRVVSVYAEPGSILNALEPGAVYSRTDISLRLVDMILAALEPAIPEKVMAACTGGGLVTISGISPRSGRFYVYNEMIGGGMGARYARDGMDGTQVHITNTGNLPVEALELEFPLRVECYELVRNSGGLGRSRGGMSIQRTVRVLGHDAVVNAGGTNSILPPFGIAGGNSGQVCRVELSGVEAKLEKRNGLLKTGDHNDGHLLRRGLWAGQGASAGKDEEGSERGAHFSRSRLSALSLRSTSLTVIAPQDIFSLTVDWMPFLLTGLGMTLLLGTGALAIGLIIGGIGATLKQRQNIFLRVLMEIYTTLVRSVPELIVVYYFYFGLNEGLKLLEGLPGAPASLQVPVFVIAIAPLGFVAGALATELFRTAYSAVPQSEVVAARAFAMPSLLLFRRVLFPHIMRYSLPGLGNIWIGLLKDSALISVMGVTELMRATTVAANSTGMPFVFYLICTALYLLVALASGGLFAWLERRYSA